MMVGKAVDARDVARIVRELREYLSRLKHRAKVRGDPASWGVAREGERLASEYLRDIRKARR